MRAWKAPIAIGEGQRLSRFAVPLLPEPHIAAVKFNDHNGRPIFL